MLRSNFKLLDTIIADEVSYEMSKLKELSPKGLKQGTAKYPALFTNRLEATDGTYLHLAAKVAFENFKDEVPEQVYLLIKKQEQKERNLSFTKYAV